MLKNGLTYRIGQYFIAGVLLFSGIIKLINPLPIQDWIAFFPNISSEIISIGLSILPLIELMLGLLTLLNMKPIWVNTSNTVMITSFLGLSIVGSLAGWEIDCGCFGEAIESSFGWSMIFRNSILTGIAVMLLLKSVRMDKTKKS